MESHQRQSVLVYPLTRNGHKFLPVAYGYATTMRRTEAADSQDRSLEAKNVVTNGDFNSGTSGWKEYKQINKRAGMHLHKIGNKHAMHLHGSCDSTGGGMVQEVTTIPGRSYTIKWEPLTGPWDGARSSKEADVKIIFGDLDKTLKVDKPGKPHIRWTGSSLILDKKPEVFEETAKVSKSKTDLIFWSPRGHCIDIMNVEVTLNPEDGMLGVSEILGGV
eukprot:s43_g18.t1